MSSSLLSIADILKSSRFEKARVIAGKKGLGRLVRWIHIMEVTETRQLLNGNELILSTGVGWRSSQKTGFSFLKQLIEHEVSGLCVELGTYITEIPADMIRLAESHDFPLIVFLEEVRFIDITQELNGLLLNRQYKMMSDLEQFSSRLNRLLLSTNAFHSILRELHRYLNVQVIYVPAEGEEQFFPPASAAERDKWLSKIHSTKNDSVIGQPIQALGHQFAHLYVASREGKWTEFDHLVLDKAATALAQDQMRLLYVEEKRKSDESRWVQKWLNGEQESGEVTVYIQSRAPGICWNGCTVCLIKLSEAERHPDWTYSSMIFRSIFEQNGFCPFVTHDGDLLTFALVNFRKKESWKKRLENALRQICQTDLIKKGHVHFGVGALTEIANIHESGRLAREALQIQEKAAEVSTPFYEDMHIYRLLLRLYESGELPRFVRDQLQVVFDYDAAQNGKMFETLKVFLEVNGSKKEAARRLFIVRQTLYHRIEKLKELLGQDFMKPEKRLALEIAVYGSQFLHRFRAGE